MSVICCVLIIIFFFYSSFYNIISQLKDRLNEIKEKYSNCIKERQKEENKLGISRYVTICKTLFKYSMKNIPKQIQNSHKQKSKL